MMLRLWDFDESPWGTPKEWHKALDAAKIVARGATELSGEGPDCFYIYRATVDVPQEAGIPTVLRNRKGDRLILTFQPGGSK